MKLFELSSEQLTVNINTDLPDLKITLQTAPLIESHNYSTSRSPPVILFWKAPWDGYLTDFDSWNCPNMPQCVCQVETNPINTLWKNKENIINADAIIFSPVFDNEWPLPGNVFTELEKLRSPSQVFAFLQREAPANTHSEKTESLVAYNGFFTDTITFRADSTLPDIHTTLFDIQVAESFVKSQNKYYDEKQLLTDFANSEIPKKTKGALSVISNCNNGLNSVKFT